MKIGEWTPSAICQVDCLDIAVIKAQRMAELKNLAEYRARHLKLITDWSIDKNLVYKALKVDPATDTTALKAQQDLLAECVRYNVKPLKLTPLHRVIPQKPKRPWWMRFFSALFTIFESPRGNLNASISQKR